MIGLALVLCLAALLRMGWPGLTEFKQDEAHIYGLALGMAEFKSFPLRGITYSVGLPESPVSIYLYALPLFVWKSPIMATLWVGLLNTASVGLAYVMTRRYWGPRAALIAALLYAAAPWAVIFSRKIWNNNLLPLFIVGYMFSGLLAFVEVRRKWLLAHLVCLSIAFQLHVSAIALAPVTIALLITCRKRVGWRMLAYGAAGAALAGAPYAVYLISRANEWTRAVMAVGSHSIRFSFDVLSDAALIVQGTYIHSLAGEQAYHAFLATIPDLTAVLWLGGALVALGAGLAIYRWIIYWRSARLDASTEAGLIVALWLIVPILFFVPHATPIYPWYLIILFPTPYLLSGILLEGLLARFQLAWQKVVLWLLPLTIAGCQVWLSLALLRFVGTQNTPGAFGTPLGLQIKIADTAKRSGAADIVVVSDGADPNVDLVPSVFDVLLRGVPHRFIDGRTTAVFPAGRAIVILWPGNYASVDLYRQWGGGHWSDTVSLRAGEGEAHLASGLGIPLLVPHPREASALLNNGAELLGSGGDVQRWELWWRAPGPVEGEDYHVFAHLLDANGARVAQSDERTYAAYDWRANDLVVNYFRLAGAGVTVRAGMYAYPSLAPANVLDAAGNPAGEWIEFPLPKP